MRNLQTSVIAALVAAAISIGTIPSVQALEVKKYPELKAFVSEMTEKHGFSATQLNRMFRCAKLRPEIIEAIERPKELLPWYEYRKNFITDDSINRGTLFWSKHERELSLAQNEYGVAPEVVVAILGVETRYGRNAGNFPIIDALTTLMLQYPARSAFFRSELEEFLLLTRETGLDACSTKGSYAGAMGLPQFMPSNYRRLAVDFDGNGKRDLLDSVTDAIGSVAHYLKQNGWERNAPVMDEAHLEGTMYFWVEKLGIKPTLSIRELAGYGIFPRGRNTPERRAALLSFDGEYGPIHRLGYHNFYVITRYNRNKRYAMAVAELSELLRTRREQKPTP